MSLAESPNYRVPSVESACRILRTVCEATGPLSLTTITAAAETSRTTALRIVSSLCHNGFLRRAEDGRYSTGDIMRLLGNRIHNESGLRQRAIPILNKLAERSGETAHLAIPLQTHCLLQEVVDSPQVVRVASRPGTLIDYHCSATGKAILADRSDLQLTLRQSMSFTKRTPNTLKNWNALETELERVRERGYALDEEEYHPGVRCVGAAIRDHTGKAVAAVGVTGTTSRLNKRRITATAQLVVAAAEELSAYA